MANECRVLEVCNPKQASEILNHNMSVNMALPCRISVYQEDGRTKIGMIAPTQLLGLVAQSEELATEAEKVEQTVIAIIEQAI